ncbi:MAG: GNAT family N-acetyltransferase [Chloroflexi bacterium]|nr:GNAT family N-acetyltransferase [Chloroflexota bacterium]
MDIEIQPASLSDKPILRNLLELCQHDYSEFDSADVDEHGLFGYNYLDNYWTEPGRHPFLVRVSGKLAGFVLVRLLDSADNQPTYSMAEFFILRKYRRLGVGREVARRIFDKFQGKWSVAQEDGNRPAQAFWRKVIAEYTNEDYEEVQRQDDEWRGPIQMFNPRETARH